MFSLLFWSLRLNLFILESVSLGYLGHVSAGFQLHGHSCTWWHGAMKLCLPPRLTLRDMQPVALLTESIFIRFANYWPHHGRIFLLLGFSWLFFPEFFRVFAFSFAHPWVCQPWRSGPWFTGFQLYGQSCTCWYGAMKICSPPRLTLRDVQPVALLTESIFIRSAGF